MAKITQFGGLEMEIQNSDSQYYKEEMENEKHLACARATAYDVINVVIPGLVPSTGNQSLNDSPSILDADLVPDHLDDPHNNNKNLHGTESFRGYNPWSYRADASLLPMFDALKRFGNYMDEKEKINCAKMDHKIVKASSPQWTGPIFKPPRTYWIPPRYEFTINTTTSANYRHKVLFEGTFNADPEIRDHTREWEHPLMKRWDAFDDFICGVDRSMEKDPMTRVRYRKQLRYLESLYQGFNLYVPEDQEHANVLFARNPGPEPSNMDLDLSDDLSMENIFLLNIPPPTFMKEMLPIAYDYIIRPLMRLMESSDWPFLWTMPDNKWLVNLFYAHVNNPLNIILWEMFMMSDNYCVTVEEFNRLFEMACSKLFTQKRAPNICYANPKKVPNGIGKTRENSQEISERRAIAILIKDPRFNEF